MFSGLGLDFHFLACEVKWKFLTRGVNDILIISNKIFQTGRAVQFSYVCIMYNWGTNIFRHRMKTTI